MDKDTATFLLGAAALLVSGSVGLVAYLQMRIASAKVKLDLYNKRFAIYAAALDFYLALWNEHDSVAALAPAMTRAYRESQFLFSESDGIYETLGKLQQHGFKAKHYFEEIREREVPYLGKTTIAYTQRRDRSAELSAYEKELKNLERQIAKYLAFTGISGWSFTSRWEGKPSSLNTEAGKKLD